MELLKLVTVNEAKEIIKNNKSYKIETEKVSILDVLERVLAVDIYSNENVPEFVRSTVDGYAVSSNDVFGASESLPAILKLVGEVKIGSVPPSDIKDGECMYVPTGGMLPNGADTVAMIEYTEKLDDETILINKPVAPLQNIVEIGEDVNKGELVLKKGTRIRPYEVGVLASLGILEVEVYKRIKVGIISTGDEVVPPTEKIELGKVRDINSYLLYSLCIEESVEPVLYGIINDDFDKLREAVERALGECDVVLMSGGSSVGTKDETVKVIKSFEGSNIFIHGIAIKPGKPTIVGKVNDKFIFGLPGHPLACAVIFKNFVAHYLDLIRNFEREEYPIECIFSVNYHKAPGRAEFLPVQIKEEDGVLKAYPTYYKSGLISCFAKSFGYVYIEKELEGLYAGQNVKVIKF
ncbi:Molybdopterin molybdenumtransferase [Caloramator mitchellensis]|uniref:Molybdopterin molybdenumtransferase n=1 Tax=Caloramator mitchellensis TaxID=908809 RepID=A0A0R3JSD3_CALMK|nr:molybdopterin molybdotransferase MoeA [Caloramator mitchellensis]KRQ86419.1 Molybdopterin molybdenumtransferase [Caloramator mitchellensis]